MEPMELDHDYLKYYTIKPNDVILDLGATVGEFGVLNAAKIIENKALLINVEPEKESFDKMKRNFHEAGLQRVMYYNYGVWDKDTTLTFILTDNPWCNMFEEHADTPQHVTIVNRISLPVLSLKTIMQNSGVDHIDFVKADIEGAELETFMNFDNLRSIKNFAIAAYHMRVDKQQHTCEILKPSFEKQGYKVIQEAIPYGHFPAYTLLYCTLDGSF
jgi:FkbM family methyltransferase